DTVEFEPDGGTAQVLGVGDKRVAVKPFFKELLAQRDRLFLLHPVNPRRQPVPFRRFHNKGGPLVIKAIGVQVEPAPFGFLEIESESVKFLAAAQPYKTVSANLNVRLEDLFIFFSCD